MNGNDAMAWEGWARPKNEKADPTIAAPPKPHDARRSVEAGRNMRLGTKPPKGKRSVESIRQFAEQVVAQRSPNWQLGMDVLYLLDQLEAVEGGLGDRKVAALRGDTRDGIDFFLKEHLQGTTIGRSALICAALEILSDPFFHDELEERGLKWESELPR